MPAHPATSGRPLVGRTVQPRAAGDDDHDHLNQRGATSPAHHLEGARGVFPCPLTPGGAALPAGAVVGHDRSTRPDHAGCGVNRAFPLPLSRRARGHEALTGRRSLPRLRRPRSVAVSARRPTHVAPLAVKHIQFNHHTIFVNPRLLPSFPLVHRGLNSDGVDFLFKSNARPFERRLTSARRLERRRIE